MRLTACVLAASLAALTALTAAACSDDGSDVDFLWGFDFGAWVTAPQQAPWMVSLVQGCP
jgi:ABC-type sugar transport system substrate-binding protein